MKLCGRIVYGSNGFAVPMPCGRVGTVAMALSRQSCADVSLMVAMALPRQSCADGRTVAKALRAKAVQTYRGDS